jgi:tetrahydromethanopterin S-methyltransferase subunit G
VEETETVPVLTERGNCPVGTVVGTVVGVRVGTMVGIVVGTVVGIVVYPDWTFSLT